VAAGGLEVGIPPPYSELQVLLKLGLTPEAREYPHVFTTVIFHGAPMTGARAPRISPPVRASLCPGRSFVAAGGGAAAVAGTSHNSADGRD
jgi:hypothetical protein